MPVPFLSCDLAHRSGDGEVHDHSVGIHLASGEDPLAISSHGEKAGVPEKAGFITKLLSQSH